ncbi:aspartate--tRNA ligase msd1 [Thecaphora frezii]
MVRALPRLPIGRPHLSATRLARTPTAPPLAQPLRLAAPRTACPACCPSSFRAYATTPPPPPPPLAPAAPSATPSPTSPSPNHGAHHGGFDSRTHLCGQLSHYSNGDDVILAGWIDSLRIVSKQLGFLTLRDHTGAVQLVVQANQQPEIEALIASISTLPLQSVVLVKGRVHLRPEADRNPSQPTGAIEVRLLSLQLLNAARRDLPFLPSDSQHTDRISADVRARHRYLDLRRKALGDNIRLRSKVAQAIRCHLYENDFLEIETPILLRSTPEGAREFLVPTRISAMTAEREGSAEPSFYALPQSPQQPKQLLIASGVTDKYFQIAKCFRDEDGRKDRQPEFTQIDLEMGFVSGGPPPLPSSAIEVQAADENDPRDARGQWRIGGWQVRDVIEGLIAKIWATAGRASLDHLYVDPVRKRGFPVLSYWSAMTQYGSDKPDLRYDLRIYDLSSALVRHDAGGSEAEAEVEGGLALDVLPHHHVSAGKLSNKELDEVLAPFQGKVERFRIGSAHNCNELAAVLLKKSRRVRDVLAVRDDETEASEVDVDRLARRLETVLAASRSAQGFAPDAEVGAYAEAGAVDVFVSTRTSKPEGGSTVMGDLRRTLALRLATKGLLSISEEPRFVWITEFPLFTLADDDKNALSQLSSAAGARWQSSHHPFTAPMAEDAHLLRPNAAGTPQDVAKVRGQHYDLVLDGQEIGGGSVRIHDAQMQRFVLRHVLQLTEPETARFHHLLDALSCGAPPHGGIALGFDRLMAILCATSSIRDVIPFPKMGSGVDPVFHSPAPIDDPSPSQPPQSPPPQQHLEEEGQQGQARKILAMYGLRPL